MVRIGGRKLTKEEMFDSLLTSLKNATGRDVQPADDEVTTPVKRTKRTASGEPRPLRQSNTTSAL